MGIQPNFKAIEKNLKRQKDPIPKEKTRPRKQTIIRNNFINSWKN